MKKWFYKKYALANAKKHPEYYKNKKLVKTTRINWDGDKRPAWRWVRKK